MFTVDQIIAEYHPGLEGGEFRASIVKPILRRILHEKAFIDFAEKFPHLQGIEFVEQVLEYFNFSYAVSDRDRENIPVNGRVMIIANHPIGSLDGLALLKMVHEVRSDVRIVANDLLMLLPPLRPLILPVRVMTGTNGKQHLQRISMALENDEAVIIFPSGEVSRLTTQGIRDRNWHRGFLKIAEKAKAPILPVHVGGCNSIMFYLASVLAKPLSTLMLVGEMFRQQGKLERLRIGPVIPYHSYQTVTIRRKEKVKLFKKHVYRIGAGKKPLFVTESAIARPERKTELKKTVRNGERLGKTPDGKTIYLFDRIESSPVLREIGRLREASFRAVGEGTGARRDIDNFDMYYKHLVLWDEDDLEIAGAYRFVDAGKVISEKGTDGLYTSSLFKFDERTCYFLDNGLELGRSFVQQRYWGRRSLDYLWYGIGAFLAKNPHYRYLFGPVSISSAIPRLARELLICFYGLYFTDGRGKGFSRNPFSFSHPLASLEKEFVGDNYRDDFKKLKSLLSNLGTAVPPLFKQYTELCEPGGVVFLDFNVDPSFNNCVDGLVIVDTHRLKEQKRKRYLEETILT